MDGWGLPEPSITGALQRILHYLPQLNLFCTTERFDVREDLQGRIGREEHDASSSRAGVVSKYDNNCFNSEPKMDATKRIW